MKIVAAQKETHELKAYRIQKVELYEFVDRFASSCFYYRGKPDIFRPALSIIQVPAGQAVYINTQLLFFEVAGLGIWGIRHMEHRPTKAKLAALELQINQDRFHAN